MEHQPQYYPTLVLKINCCSSHARKLKRWMVKINGVITVEVDPQNRLVYVTGKIDPKKLIEMINSNPKFKNKGATLVSTQKQCNRSRREEDLQHNDVNKDRNKHCHDCDTVDPHENSAFGRHGSGHKPEFNVPPVSRDHMTDDVWGNLNIHDGLPYMHHPFPHMPPCPGPPPPLAHTILRMPPPYSTYGPPLPAHATRMLPDDQPPPPLPPQYSTSYNWDDRLIRRPNLLGLDNVGEFFSDETTWGCSIM